MSRAYVRTPSRCRVWLRETTVLLVAWAAGNVPPAVACVAEIEIYTHMQAPPITKKGQGLGMRLYTCDLGPHNHVMCP